MKSGDKHLLAKIGQYVLLVNETGKVLVLQRKRSEVWSLPGGRLEKDERDWRKAIAREVEEETGYKIGSLKPFDIKIIEDKWQIKYCVFFVNKLVQKRDPKLSEEHIAYKWLDKRELADIELDDEPKVRKVLEKYLKH
ncbi:NUDIX hydrolase [Candidatus Woesebacteria bacterium]|nr:NUDIX hydrolase [Candidatus Woesebacteria bacterium]